MNDSKCYCAAGRVLHVDKFRGASPLSIIQSSRDSHATHPRRSSAFVCRTAASRVCALSSTPDLAACTQQTFFAEPWTLHAHHSYKVKQVLQNLKTGDTAVQEIPCPRARPGHLLIRTAISLVSPGRNECWSSSARRTGWTRRDSSRTRCAWCWTRSADGWLPPSKPGAKLDQPLALGYCNVGVVARDWGRGRRFRYRRPRGVQRQAR